MVTLKQIAAKADVSVRSVSVVLNGKAVEGRISPMVAQKILNIATELNYRPNSMARAIRMKKTFQIGVLVRELATPSTGKKIEAIEHNLLSNGYKLLLGLTNGSLEVAKSYLSDFSNGMVDGILNLDPLVDTQTFQAARVTVPYLHFLRPSPDFSVRFDYFKGLWIATDYLWGFGHRKIGFISGPKGDSGSQERIQGFKAFLEKHSKTGYTQWIEFGDWSFQSGKRCAPRLLEKGCTAIIGANDLMTVGAMKAVQASGLKIPEQISVCGFDDSLIAEMATPPLCSVRIPVEELARLSVDALMAHISEQPSKEAVLVEPVLAVRDSIAPIRPDRGRAR
ncbi:MAG: LacI family DNA-binding transcriptional regulator [Chthoniobacteraceae bacterium]